MRAKFGSDPTASSKNLSFKFISRYRSEKSHFLEEQTRVRKAPGIHKAAWTVPHLHIFSVDMLPSSPSTLNGFLVTENVWGWSSISNVTSPNRYLVGHYWISVTIFKG